MKKNDTSLFRKQTCFSLQTKALPYTQFLYLMLKWLNLEHLLTPGRRAHPSKNLINKLKKYPIRKECERLVTLLHSVVEKVKIHNLEIQDIN